MKLLTRTSMLVLGFCLFAAQMEAQTRKNRVRAQTTARSDLKNVAVESAAEDEKRVKECEVTDRPKPQGDIMRVSQLCGRAISMPKPPYPDEAKSTKVSGTVEVDVVINEQGSVVWAKAISGPDLLRTVSEKAACRTRYSPTVVSGRAIKTESRILYNFVVR